MAIAGEGYNVHVTGLTHDERGYPAINAAAQKKLMDRLMAKIRSHAEEIIEVEEYYVEGAEVLCVTYGSTARSTKKAVRRARQEGLKAGLLRLVAVWPFPENLTEEISTNIKCVLVPEGNYGQIVHPVREFAQCLVEGIPHPGGDLIQPETIYQAIAQRSGK